MVLRCKLRIPSLGVTVRHHSASLVMPNSYPCDGIFNQHLTTIKESYSPTGCKIFVTKLRQGNVVKTSLVQPYDVTCWNLMSF